MYWAFKKQPALPNSESAGCFLGLCSQWRGFGNLLPPPRGRAGERALGTHGELGCRLLFESGYGGDTPCSVFEFSAARRVCPLPNPLPRERGWVQAALKVSGNLSNGFCSDLKIEKTVRRHAHRFAESKIQTDGSLHFPNPRCRLLFAAYILLF